MKALVYATYLPLLVGLKQLAPFNGADTIVLTVPESGSAALAKLVAVAETKGYKVDTLTTGLLTTVPRSYEFRKGNGSVVPTVHRFRAVLQGGHVIRLQGTFRIPLFGNQLFESVGSWDNSTTATQNSDCFLQAQVIAFAYPGARIAYAKRR